MNAIIPGIETHFWDGIGYQPLVFSHDWMVALLNWEPIFDINNANEIERHNQSDEVFVLLRGQAVLFAGVDMDQLQMIAMKPGTVYNVLKGTWHNLLATKDAAWIIVENRETHLYDTEIRPLTDQEKYQMSTSVPDWAKK